MSKHRLLVAVLIGILFLGIFLILRKDTTFTIGGIVEEIVHEASEAAPTRLPNGDLPKQKPLANPPSEIKAIYATAWSAGTESRVEYFLDLFERTEANAIVIDVKDYTGIVSYQPDVPLVIEYDAYEERIGHINEFIKRMHDAGIYVIGRLAVFEDDLLARKRPDLALMSKSTGEVWGTNKDIAWMDAAARPVWDYNIAIAQDMIDRGFDEVNFDYIRFPSDGKLSDIAYPYWDEVTPKREILRSFFAYVRSELPDATISADLFGEVTYARISGVGQMLEDAFPYFDYIAPMVYPSHYAKGFNGIAEPAKHPYEVIMYSMQPAMDRLVAFHTGEETVVIDGVTSTQPYLKESANTTTKFRPWFQDFDLGADYTAEMIRAQIKAFDDVTVPGWLPVSADHFKNGWMMWAPSNRYTEGSLLPAE